MCESLSLWLCDGECMTVSVWLCVWDCVCVWGGVCVYLFCCSLFLSIFVKQSWNAPRWQLEFARGTTIAWKEKRRYLWGTAEMCTSQRRTYIVLPLQWWKLNFTMVKNAKNMYEQRRINNGEIVHVQRQNPARVTLKSACVLMESRPFDDKSTQLLMWNCC